jgi:hypothetical protein
MFAQKLNLDIRNQSVADDVSSEENSVSFIDDGTEGTEDESGAHVDESGYAGMDESDLDEDDGNAIDLSDLLQRNQDSHHSIGRNLDNVLFIQPMKQDNLRLQSVQEKFSTVFGTLLLALDRNRGMFVSY